MKGKGLFHGSRVLNPRGGTESIALKILEALALDPDRDMRRERLSLSAFVGAIKDNKIDPFFWIGGLPTGGILDLASSPGFQINLLAHDGLLEKINKKYGPRYHRYVIPKETYPGMAHPVSVIATGNLLLCREEMEEEISYQIVKAIFEHRE